MHKSCAPGRIWQRLSRSQTSAAAGTAAAAERQMAAPMVARRQRRRLRRIRSSKASCIRGTSFGQRIRRGSNRRFRQRTALSRVVRRRQLQRWLQRRLRPPHPQLAHPMRQQQMPHRQRCLRQSGQPPLAPIRASSGDSSAGTAQVRSGGGRSGSCEHCHRDWRSAPSMQNPR